MNTSNFNILIDKDDLEGKAIELTSLLMRKVVFVFNECIKIKNKEDVDIFLNQDIRKFILSEIITILSQDNPLGMSARYNCLKEAIVDTIKKEEISQWPTILKNKEIVFILGRTKQEIISKYNLDYKEDVIDLEALVSKSDENLKKFLLEKRSKDQKTMEENLYIDIPLKLIKEIVQEIMLPIKQKAELNQDCLIDVCYKPKEIKKDNPFLNFTVEKENLKKSK